MKTINRNSIIALALFVLLWMAEPASAFYSPSAQRWVNRDPIQEAGGMNLYAFSVNDSVDRFDPTGLAITFSRECNAEEKLICTGQCFPDGVKSCTVQEDFKDIPGKPPERTGYMKSCVCNTPQPPPAPTPILVPDTEPGSCKRNNPSKWSPGDPITLDPWLNPANLFPPVPFPGKIIRSPVRVRVPVRLPAPA
jgi:hypothetical protein